MRTFELHRKQDETGVSGTGIIAEGCVFEDGWCALRWRNEPRTTTLFPSLAVVEHIHGHGGKTQILWTGDALGRGFADAVQDQSENAPYGSVGGWKERERPVAPAYVTPHEHAAYLMGYLLAMQQPTTKGQAP